MAHSINTVFELMQTQQYINKRSTAKDRITKLKALKSCIATHESDIYDALRKDLRKSEFEAAVTEVLFTYGEIDFAIRNLKKWMAPKRIGKSMSSLFARNRIYYEPKGICLILAPWNYPFQLLISPLVSAIAAGNCVILKPSELSPNTSKLVHQLIEDCFDTGEVACFEGDAGLATKLLELPFNHIFFTGSTPVGKVVMSAAAKNLSSVTLELGGKSPVIIERSYDLKKAAEKIAWGKLINAGQTCIAPDYLFIPEDLETAFIREYQKAVHQLFYKEDGQLDAASYCKIINERNYKRLKRLMEDAIERGAELTFGGEMDNTELVIAPAVLTKVSADCRIRKEEIFGPVLPIVTYNDLGTIPGIINSGSKPLALYIFSNNAKATNNIIKSTSAGGTCVNDVLIHISNPKLPFGGVNDSGTGSAHGIFGFKAFSHERAVVFQSGMNVSRLIYPPYSGKMGLLKWLKKLM